MIISPITKERLEVQVQGSISRRLNELRNNDKLNKRVIRYEALRALAVSAVPIVLKFPFKAAIIDEQSQFKCNVLNNDFTINTEDICKFEEIENDTFNGTTMQVVKCKCSRLGYGVFQTNK